MNINTLRSFIDVAGINQSRLADMAGISRQAVSLWFQKGAGQSREINIRSDHLRKLSIALGISSDELYQALPAYADPAQLAATTSELLWDRLYPSLAKFIAALRRREKPALARLVQVYGLFRAEKIIGRKAWKLFPEYRTFIFPVRRQQLDILWNSQARLGLS